MNNKNLYVDFHIIQTVPPSCINRDDVGRPKTAIYGGVTRARVSSQAWKHAIRKKFKKIFTSEDLGYRTKYSVDLVSKAIQELNPEISIDDAIKLASTSLKNAGVIKESKDNVTITDALFFISNTQIKKLAELSVNGEKDKKLYKEALKNAPSIDIALFGRMVASDQDLNVDATSRVAHSISTHAVQNEYDYFTALDDKNDKAGAGHLGTMEFNSSTLYRYATVNVSKLYQTIESDIVPMAIRGFAEAFIFSMPTGKQNSYANETLPSMIYVTIRDNQPINLVGAFEKPIFSNNGYTEKSISTLCDYAQKVYADYCDKPKYSLILGSDLMPNAERVNINQLLDKLQEYITNEVI